MTVGGLDVVLGVVGGEHRGAVLLVVRRQGTCKEGVSRDTVQGAGAGGGAVERRGEERGGEGKPCPPHCQEGGALADHPEFMDTRVARVTALQLYQLSAARDTRR